MMPIRLEVLGGSGTVCRTGDVGAWFVHGMPTTLAERLYDLAKSATAGSKMADELATDAQKIAEAGSSESLAFVLLVAGATTSSLVLRGGVAVSDDSVELLSGAGTSAIVSMDVLTGRYLVVRGSNDPDLLNRAGCLPFDLHDGVVPGGGFVLHFPDQPQPSAAPTDAEPEPLRPPGPGIVFFDLSTPAPNAPTPLPVESVGSDRSIVQVHEEVRPGSDEPVPDSPLDPAVEGVPDDSVGGHRVVGLRCVRGHFNHPDALFCHACGIGMVQKSIALTDGLRPSLGVLLVDDGTTFGLNADFIIGRSPELSDDVMSGAARALTIDDGTGKISRTHARVSLQGWRAEVMDLNSQNGTRVFNPGDSDWQPLQHDEAVELQPGGRIAIGGRRIEYQTLQRH